jgi:hypothetical protein
VSFKKKTDVVENGLRLLVAAVGTVKSPVVVNDDESIA